MAAGFVWFYNGMTKYRVDRVGDIITASAAPRRPHGTNHSTRDAQATELSRSTVTITIFLYTVYSNIMFTYIQKFTTDLIYVIFNINVVWPMRCCISLCYCYLFGRRG